MPVIDIRPAPDEVAVFNLAPGVTMRLHQREAAAVVMREHNGFDGEPLIGCAPGDRNHLGWGTGLLTYTTLLAAPGRPLTGIRNGHHKRDRAVWHEAEHMVRYGGVVYIQMEQRGLARQASLGRGPGADGKHGTVRDDIPARIRWSESEPAGMRGYYATGRVGSLASVVFRIGTDPTG